MVSQLCLSFRFFSEGMGASLHRLQYLLSLLCYASLRSKRFQSSYCAKVRAEAFFALVPAF